MWPPPVGATVEVFQGVRCGPQGKEPAVSSKQRGGPTGADVQQWSATGYTAPHQRTAVGAPSWRTCKETAQAPSREEARSHVATQKALDTTTRPQSKAAPSAKPPTPYVKPTEVTRGRLQTLLLKNKTGSDTEPEPERNADEKTWEAEASATETNHRQKNVR